MPVMCFTPVADLDEDFTDFADVTSVCLDELVASLEPAVQAILYSFSADLTRPKFSVDNETELINLWR